MVNGDPRPLRKTHPNPSFLQGPVILREANFWREWVPPQLPSTFWSTPRAPGCQWRRSSILGGVGGVVPTSTVVGWWRFQQQIIRLFTTRGEIWSMFNGILLEGPRLRDLKKKRPNDSYCWCFNKPTDHHQKCGCETLKNPKKWQTSEINLSNRLGKLPNLKWIRNIGFLFTKQHHQWSHGPLTSTALVMVDGCLAQSWHTTASRWVHNMGLFFDRKMVDLQVVCICYLQVVEIGNLRNKNLYL